MEWSLPRLEVAGNALRRRPLGAAGLRRPESEYARARRAYDGNPRYKPENVAHLDLEMTDRTTGDLDGAALSYQVRPRHRNCRPAAAGCCCRCRCCAGRCFR